MKDSYQTPLEIEEAIAQTSAMGSEILRAHVAAAAMIPLEEVSVHLPQIHAIGGWCLCWWFGEGDLDVDFRYYWETRWLSFTVDGQAGHGGCVEIFSGALLHSRSGQLLPSPLKEHVTRFLYRMGFDVSPAEEFEQMTAHERLELRLSLPTEYWPPCWLAAS